MCLLPSKHRKPAYWLSSGYLFLFFITWAIWWSFYAIWLKNSLGLNGTEVGTVYSLNSFFSLFFMIIYGVYQDKLGTRRDLLWGQASILVCIAPFIVYVYEPLLLDHFYVGAALGALYFGAGFLAGAGFLEAYTERLSRKYHFEFGRARMWGSLGYAIAALSAGVLMSINPHINFWFASGIGALFLLLILFVKVEASAGGQEDDVAKITTAKLAILLKDKRLWFFVIFLFGTSSVYTVYDQQFFPVYFVGLFPSDEAGNTIYGILNSIQVFVEALFLFLAPAVVDKLGVKRSLVTAGSIMAARIFGSAIVANEMGISCIKMLHAVELPILLIAMFKYISDNFDVKLSATVYLVGVRVSGEIGVILFSAVLGRVYDATSYRVTFYVLGAIVSMFIIFAILTLKNERSRESGVPEQVRSESMV